MLHSPDRTISCIIYRVFLKLLEFARIRVHDLVCVGCSFRSVAWEFELLSMLVTFYATVSCSWMLFRARLMHLQKRFASKEWTRQIVIYYKTVTGLHSRPYYYATRPLYNNGTSIPCTGCHYIVCIVAPYVVHFSALDFWCSSFTRAIKWNTFIDMVPSQLR